MIIRPIEARDNKAVAHIIQSTLESFGAVGEGYAWADPEVHDTHKLAYHSHIPLLVLKDRVQAPVLYTSPSRAKFVFGNTSRASFSNPSNSS